MQGIESTFTSIGKNGYELGMIRKAMDLGANMIMFDGSRLSYEQNIARTREVVEVAHTRGLQLKVSWEAFLVLWRGSLLLKWQ